MIYTTVRKISLKDASFNRFFIMNWSWKEVPLKNDMAKKLVKVITPIPPTWISMSSTTCPVNVKVAPVSTTVNPVTHTALVEVNKASMKLIPSYVALGNLNKTAPKRMINKKLAAKRTSAFTRLRKTTNICFESCMILNSNTTAYVNIRSTLKRKGLVSSKSGRSKCLENKVKANRKSNTNTSIQNPFSARSSLKLNKNRNKPSTTKRRIIAR